MIRSARHVAAVIAVAAATWLVVAGLCYLVLPRTLYRIYQTTAREIVQVACGRIVASELIYTLKPGVCRFANAEFDTTLTIDADGFRNDPAHRGSGPIRVAVLGDSFAMGWGVEQHETLASLLVRDKRLTVRDLAMSSYGTARELFAFQRYAADADVVIIQYTNNDIHENEQFLADPAGFVANGPARAVDYGRQLEAYDGRSRAVRGVQAATTMFLSGITATWRLLRLPPRATRPTPQAVVEREARAFAAVMARFRPALEGKTVIVIETFQRIVRANSPPAFRAALDAAGLGHVAVLDLSGTLSVSDFFYLDDHLTARGHARLAARILAELDKPGRLPAGR